MRDDTLHERPGPLFVELRDATPERVAAASALRGPVCVASPAEPDPSWCVVTSPAPAEYLSKLGEWLSLRLPADGRFPTARVVEWLAQGPLSEGVIDGLDSALGWMGLVDRFGLAALSGKRAPAVAELYFRAQLAGTHGSKEANVAWLRQSGMMALGGIARRLLTLAPDDWDRPRTFEQWMDLVPEEYQKSVDVEWVKLALSDRKSVRASDVDNATRRLPPGPFRVVQALSRAGFFAEGDGDRLVLSPRWFGLALTRHALGSLLNGSPAEWGEALLGAARAPEIAARLYERLVGGEPLDQVLEFEDASDPAWVAALECAFRTSGLALLAGAEVSHETLEGLWDEQLGLVLTLSRLPRPRIEYGTGGEHAALLTRGAWNLAALAISEQLPAGVGKQHATLRPWTATAHDTDPLGRLLDEALAAVLAAGPRCEWAVGAFALVDRLTHVVGHAAGSVHPLAAPGRLVDEVDHDVLEWSSVEALANLPHATPALERVASARNIPWHRVAGAVWNAWTSAGCPELGGTLLDPHSAASSLYWSNVPTTEVGRAEEHATRDALSDFDGARWDALVAHWIDTASAMTARAAKWIPAEAFRSWLERATPRDLSSETWSHLWERFATELGSKARTLIASGDIPAAIGIFEGAPLERTPDLVELLSRGLDWQRQSPDVIEPVRETLHRRIAERAPAWRAAYDLVAGIEKALSTRQRALG
jgi:hypothetical protein